MERALKDGRNPDYPIRMLPGANHRFEEAITGGPERFFVSQENCARVQDDVRVAKEARWRALNSAGCYRE